jgi:hypothetical protein
MTFAVHVKNSIPMSRIRKQTNAGLEPAYQTKYEATEQQDDTRYAKNFMRMSGNCAKCEHKVKSKMETTTGEHCSQERCVK